MDARERLPTDPRTFGEMTKFRGKSPTSVRNTMNLIDNLDAFVKFRKNWTKFGELLISERLESKGEDERRRSGAKV